MKRKYYIAYGSNLNINQMLTRCPDAIKIGTASIEDYELTFRGNRRSGVANIEPAAGKAVPVGVWAISDRDEVALDRYEGWPWLYEKQIFQIAVNGRTVEAMAYVMTPGHKVATPSGYYLDVIEEGYGDFGLDVEPLLKAAADAQKGAVA